MVKILVVVTMIGMGKADESILNFMKKTEKLFEDVKGEVEGLKMMVIELKAENAELKVDNSVLKTAMNEMEEESLKKLQNVNTEVVALKAKIENTDTLVSELKDEVEFK